MRDRDEEEGKKYKGEIKLEWLLKGELRHSGSSSRRRHHHARPLSLSLTL